MTIRRTTRQRHARLLLLLLAGLSTLLAACGMPSLIAAQHADAAILPASVAVNGKVLYARNGEVWLIEGANHRQFTKSGGIALQPAWSPDGASIAYVLRHKNSSDIAMVKADGMGTTLITDNSSSVVDENFWAFNPVWNIDSKQVAFMSDRGRAESGIIDLAIWRMTIASKQVRQVSDPRGLSGGDADPAWRPGHPNELVYTRYFYGENGGAVFSQLVLIDTTTGKWVELTPPNESSYQPAWSPRGDMLVFAKRGPDRSDLYALAVTDNATPTPSFAPSTLLLSGVLCQPVWSPTGDQIMYISESSDAGFDLWLATLTNDTTPAIKGKPVQVTTREQVDATSRPSWIR